MADLLEAMLFAARALWRGVLRDLKRVNDHGGGRRLSAAEGPGRAARHTAARGRVTGVIP
jgi:hypothetical protein